MNPILMENIVEHIFANLGLIAVPYIDHRHTRSLINKEYRLLDKQLTFGIDTDTVHRPVYACQVTLANKTFKVMVGDCSQDSKSPEYCVVIQLTDMPAYGMYLVCSHELDKEALIAVTINDKDWMPCSTFLQATCLAAMEQLRDIGMGWSKCVNYNKHYDTLLSMIQFHNSYYEEVTNEGQEIRSRVR